LLAGNAKYPYGISEVSSGKYCEVRIAYVSQPDVFLEAGIPPASSEKPYLSFLFH